MGRCCRVSEILRAEPYYTREGFRGRYAIGDPARRARGRLIVTYFFFFFTIFYPSLVLKPITRFEYRNIPARQT